MDSFVASGNATYNKGAVGGRHEDDVVICAFARTPMTKGKRGGFKDTAPELMLASVLQAVVKRASIDPK